MSALSDGRNWGARDPEREGSVRDDPRWQRLTGLNRDGVPVAEAASPATADPAGDEARQKLRRLERAVRRWKLVARTALVPAARRQAEARVRDTQAQIRAHVEATGLHRQRYREQLFLDNQPPLT